MLRRSSVPGCVRKTGVNLKIVELSAAAAGHNQPAVLVVAGAFAAVLGFLLSFNIFKIRDLWVGDAVPAGSRKEEGRRETGMLVLKVMGPVLLVFGTAALVAGVLDLAR